MTLDEIQKKLCRGEFSSFTISWNDGNGPNYQTVAQMLSNRDDYYSDDDFISLEERKLCIANNSMWTAHWYPDTPVGFCKMHASTFEKLREYLEGTAKEETK